MKTLVIASAAALLLAAPMAFAASKTVNTVPVPTVKATAQQHLAASTLMDQCTSLGSQFDKVELKHKSDKNYKQAVALRAEGKTLCTSHKEADGVKKIESALTMIGVKPSVKS